MVKFQKIFAYILIIRAWNEGDCKKISKSCFNFEVDLLLFQIKISYIKNARKRETLELT